MKDSQWAVAVGALAVLVFLIVFAGQYLGGGPGGTGKPAPKTTISQRELTFHSKNAPEGGGAIEVEEKSSGEAFFYFINENDQPVKVGLVRSSCKCTEAELYLIPADAEKRFAPLFVSVVANAMPNPLVAGGVYARHFAAFQAAAQRSELKKDKEAVPVPARAGGWVRMGWNTERAGPQMLDATLWMEDMVVGKTATLQIHSLTQEAFRVQPILPFDTVREGDLREGVRREFLITSVTRPAFRVVVNPGSVRTDPKSDPMEFAKPIPLTAEECRALRADHSALGLGQVLSGWKVPVTLRAVAADGKTPFDIGPFRRQLMVTSPDFPHLDARLVNVHGRVRGVVEIGNDSENGEVSLGSFPRKRGKMDAINLTSDLAELDLKVDAARSAKFLEATLEPPQSAGGGRRVWKLRLAVKPGAAVGRFPRKDDPVYEDSAVYLLGSAPGQTPRSVRIAVYGTATDG